MMNGLYTAAREVSAFLASKKWRFCIIGGLAIQRWGEPRQTLDVDLTLLTGFGEESDYITALLQQYRSRVPNPVAFAERNRILLLQCSDGTGVDISLGGLPYEERMMDRSSSFAFTPHCTLVTCSAEDLIVLKAFAGRSRDWLDIEGVRNRCGKSIKWQLVFKELAPLLEIKGEPEAMTRLKGLAKG